jgi:hypothetical protein
MRLLIRCVLALSVVVLGLTMVMGDAPTVRANLEHCDGQPTYLNGFGGGGYCPPEYSTCEDEDGDGCIDIDIGGGGGGDWEPPIDGECGTSLGYSTTGDYQVADYGLCSSLPVCVNERNARNANIPPASDARFDCWASPTQPESSGRHLVFWRNISCGGNGAISQVGAWTVADGGDCLSTQRCHQKRDAINVGLPSNVATRAYCWRSLRAPETSGTYLVLAERNSGPTTTTTTTSTTIPTTTPPTTIRPPRDIDPEIVWVS